MKSTARRENLPRGGAAQANDSVPQPEEENGPGLARPRAAAGKERKRQARPLVMKTMLRMGKEEPGLERCLRADHATAMNSAGNSGNWQPMPGAVRDVGRSWEPAESVFMVTNVGEIARWIVNARRS